METEQPDPPILPPLTASFPASGALFQDFRNRASRQLSGQAIRYLLALSIEDLLPFTPQNPLRQSPERRQAVFHPIFQTT